MNFPIVSSDVFFLSCCFDHEWVMMFFVFVIMP